VSFEFEPEVSGQTLLGSISLDGTVMNPGQDVEITVDHHGSCQKPASFRTNLWPQKTALVFPRKRNGCAGFFLRGISISVLIFFFVN